MKCKQQEHNLFTALPHSARNHSKLFPYHAEVNMGLFGRNKVGDHSGVDAPVTGPPAVTNTNDIGARSRHPAALEIMSKALRLLQFLMAVLILGLVGYALHVYSDTFVSYSTNG